MQENKQPFEAMLGEELNSELEAAGITVSEELIAKTLQACKLDAEENTSAEKQESVAQPQRGRRKWVRTLAYSLGSIAAAVVLLVLGSQALSGGIKGNSTGDGLNQFFSGLLPNSDSSMDSIVAPTGYDEVTGCEDSIVRKPEANSDSDYSSKNESASGEPESNETTDAITGSLFNSFGNWFSNCDTAELANNQTGTTVEELADANILQLMNLVRQEIEQNEILEPASNYILTDVTYETDVTVSLDLEPLTQLFQEQVSKNASPDEGEQTEISDIEVEYRFLITTGENIEYYRVTGTGTIEYTVFLPDGTKQCTILCQPEEEGLILEEIELWLQDYELAVE